VDRYSLDLTIDLSKYLNDGSKPDYGPSLQMHYYVMGSHSWDSYSGQSLALEQAVALTLALRF